MRSGTSASCLPPPLRFGRRKGRPWPWRRWGHPCPQRPPAENSRIGGCAIHKPTTFEENGIYFICPVCVSHRKGYIFLNEVRRGLKGPVESVQGRNIRHFAGLPIKSSTLLETAALETVSMRRADFALRAELEDGSRRWSLWSSSPHGAGPAPFLSWSIGAGTSWRRRWG